MVLRSYKFLASLMFLPVILSAKEVTVCSSYGVGAYTLMECQGGVNRPASITDMYDHGWVLIESIAGANKFILVFEK